MNDIPAGYKQTEVGVIPEDWEVHTLRSCLSAQPDYGINAPAVPFSDKLPAYIRITDITEDGRLSPEKPVSVKRADADHYYLNAGDIVFARTGASVGKSYLYEPKDGKLVFAGFLIRVRPDAAKLVPAYLAGYVTTGAYWNWVHLMSMRSGQPGINGQEYGHLPIPLPPTIDEQRAIAGVLSDVDELIGALDQLIAKKRDLKQAAMQQLLIGQTRLPGFSGEWRVKSNGELAGGDENIVDGPFGSNLKNSDYTQRGVPVLQGLNITGDKFVWKEVRYISEKKAKEVFRSNAQIGDLLTVKIGSVGFSALIDYLDGHRFAIIPANLLRVRFRGTACDPHFLYYALSSTRGKRTLKDLAANTAQPALGLTGFRKLLVPVPNSIKEQTAIAAVLSDMDAEIATLQARRDKTRALKQGMMQELLTGKTRLL